MLFQCTFRKELKSWPSVSTEEVNTLHLVLFFIYESDGCNRKLNKTSDQSTAGPDQQLCCNYTVDKIVEIILSAI